MLLNLCLDLELRIKKLTGGLNCCSIKYTKNMEKLNPLYYSGRIGKQIIRVFALKTDSKGKISKQECFDGLLTEITSAGINLIPINKDWGSSSDNLASSFLAWPERRKDGNYEYKIFKELA